jgi:hypothetical protein
MEWLEKIQKIVLSNLIIFNFSAEIIFQEKKWKKLFFLFAACWKQMLCSGKAFS